MIGISAPFFAIVFGGDAAETIKSGKAAFLLDQDQSVLPAPFKSGAAKEFVGDIGGYHVFYELEGKLFFLKSADGQVIALTKNPSAHERSFL